jgi:transposase
VVYRFRTGIAWRDLPERFGPWQTVWKRHRRFSGDGTWDRIHSARLARADDLGEIDWSVSVDSTISRAHQHGTNRPERRGRATRYDKRALTYRAGVVLGAIVTWLRELSGTPWTGLRAGAG